MKSSKRKGDTYIPNAPFVAWLRHELGVGDDPDNPSHSRHSNSGREQLAARLNITVRTLYRHLYRLNGCSKPTSVISRIGVEEMLHAAGVSFYDMYPAFAHERDIEIEPDEFCRLCGEWVTPINGRCPWDDCDLMDWAA